MKNIFIAITLLQLTTKSFGQLIPDSTFAIDAIKNETNLGVSKLVEFANGDILNVGQDLFSKTMLLKRFDKQGNIVSSFGIGGIATNSAFAPYINNIGLVDVKILKNSDIVVLGNILEYTNFWDTTYMSSFILLFDSNGVVKNSFGGAGFIIDKPIANREFDATCIAVDETNINNPIIYIAGTSYLKGHTNCNNGYGNWFISSYNYNGNSNLNFNTLGYKVGDAAVINQSATLSSNTFIGGIKIMPNRNILAVGHLSYDDRSIFSMKLDTVGNWVNSYGINGRSIVNIDTGLISFISKAYIFDDNSMMLLESYPHSMTDTIVNRMYKLTNSGNLDFSFGINGKVNLNIYNTNFPIVTSRKNNSFLFSYYSNHSITKKAEFISFNANGNIDSNFGINGILRTEPIIFNSIDSNGWCLPNCLIFNSDETELYYSFQSIYAGDISIVNYKFQNYFPLNIETINPFLISLYPNPVYNNLINIESKFEINTVEIYNKYGSLIVSKNFNEKVFKVQLPNNIPSDFYILKLVSLNKIQLVKILKY